MVALFAASLALLPLVSLAQQQPIKAEVDRDEVAQLLGIAPDENVAIDLKLTSGED